MLHLWGVTSPIDWRGVCMFQPHSASGGRPVTTYSPAWEGPSAIRPPTPSSDGATGRRDAQIITVPREWFWKLLNGIIPRQGAWLAAAPTTCNNALRVVSLFIWHTPVWSLAYATSWRLYSVAMIFYIWEKYLFAIVTVRKCRQIEYCIMIFLKKNANLVGTYVLSVIRLTSSSY